MFCPPMGFSQSRGSLTSYAFLSIFLYLELSWYMEYRGWGYIRKFHYGVWKRCESCSVVCPLNQIFLSLFPKLIQSFIIRQEYVGDSPHSWANELLNITVNTLLTDTSLKRTHGVGPCCTSVIYFISLPGGHVSKADSRSWSRACPVP